jgi:hypothetical protein
MDQEQVATQAWNRLMTKAFSAVASFEQWIHLGGSIKVTFNVCVDVIISPPSMQSMFGPHSSAPVVFPVCYKIVR